jgi:hypothetical protein
MQITRSSLHHAKGPEFTGDVHIDTVAAPIPDDKGSLTDMPIGTTILPHGRPALPSQVKG